MSTVTIDNLFSLAITQRLTSTQITMQSLGEHVNTAHLPHVVTLLDMHLPTVLQTTCYNEENLPFAREVEQTEIGHLFEHILLEYLCQLKIAKGHKSAVFSGRTKWNWIRDPWGKFHIRLSCGQKDADILPIAVEKTVALMTILMNTSSQQMTTQLSKFTPNGLKNGEQSR